VKVDMANQCVLFFPSVAFRSTFSTIKNVVMPEGDNANLVANQLYSAGNGGGWKGRTAKYGQVEQKYAPYAALSGKMTFRAGMTHLTWYEDGIIR
jgi:hypothetical protein